MFALMLILPILASFAAGLGGRSLGITGVNIIVLTCLFTSTLFSLLLGYEVIFAGSHISLRLGGWVDLVSNGYIDWGFILDPLAAWLTGTVLLISFVVHIFATSYMSSDPAPQRFMCLLVAFTGSMVILVTGDSLGVLFLGWELIGITSFLLIGYWWDRAAACNAAIQALIINRVGDFSFTLALMLVISTASTLDLNALMLWISCFEPYGTLIKEDIYFIGISGVGIFLVIAAFGKSAQFLLHTWLPLSMEGPTPVSALLHAATLVAGGTYLLLRCSFIVNLSTTALLLAATIGTITAVFAATTALFQSDAKRIIAYSTCSQFGYLTASIGLGQTSSTLFHLASHSGFKALLFITAGGVIHATSDQQDIRRLGGLISSLPFTYTGMLIGSLSLIATPYLSGFYSKDFILELAAAQWTWPSTWMWLCGSVVAGITACYSVRLIAYIYLGTPSAPKKVYENSHEQPMAIMIPIVILSFLAIMLGYFAKDATIGMGIPSGTSEVSASATFLFNKLGSNIDELNKDGIAFIASITHQLSGETIVAEFGLSTWRKNLPLLCTFIGIMVGSAYFITNIKKPKTNELQTTLAEGTGLNLNENLREANEVFFFTNNITTTITERIGKGFINKWWIDSLYARSLSWPGFSIGLFCSKIIDKGIIEVLGPAGLKNVFMSFKSVEAFTLDNAHLISLEKATFFWRSFNFSSPSSAGAFGTSSFNSSSLSQEKIRSFNLLLLKRSEQNKRVQERNESILNEQLTMTNRKKGEFTGSNLSDYSSYIVSFTLISLVSILIYNYQFSTIDIQSLAEQIWANETNINNMLLLTGGLLIFSTTFNKS